MATLTEEDRIKFSNFFHEVVAETGDSEGKLDRDGFKKLMPMCGYTLPLAETGLLFSSADDDGDWKISLDDFLGIFSKPNPFPALTTAAMLRNKFEEHDLDGDGYISFEEFKALMTEGGLVFNEEIATALMTAWDTNGDGRINFEEFVKMYLERDEDEEEDEVDEETRKELEQNSVKLKDVLVTADKIRRLAYERGIVKFGRVTVEELKSVLSVVKMQLADEQFRTCLNLLDAEGYGAVNFEEFIGIFEDMPVDKFRENEDYAETEMADDSPVQQTGTEKISEKEARKNKKENNVSAELVDMTQADGCNEDGESCEENAVHRTTDQHSIGEEEKNERKKSRISKGESEMEEAVVDFAKISATFEGKNITKVGESGCHDDGAQAECRNVEVKAMIAQLENASK